MSCTTQITHNHFFRYLFVFPKLLMKLVILVIDKKVRINNI